MARKSGRGATGPKPATQGKMIGPKSKPANQGPEDTAHSNGNWDGGKLSTNVKTPVIRGSRKSF